MLGRGGGGEIATHMTLFTKLYFLFIFLKGLAMGTIWIFYYAFHCDDDENSFLYCSQWGLIRQASTTELFEERSTKPGVSTSRHD